MTLMRRALYQDGILDVDMEVIRYAVLSEKRPSLSLKLLEDAPVPPQQPY